MSTPWERAAEEEEETVTPWARAAAEEDTDDAAVDAYLSRRKTEKEDTNLIDDVLKPWWEDYRFEEDTYKPTRHVARGVAKGLSEVADIPHMLSQASRWATKKVAGEDRLEFGDENPVMMPFSQEIPAVTPWLAENETTAPVFDWLTKSEYPEGGVDEEGNPVVAPDWARRGRVATEWGGAGPINAARKGAFKAATPDAFQAAGAVAGDIIDQYTGDDSAWGQLFGGLSGTLAALRKGDFSKLGKEDRVAWDFLVENIEEGRSIDDLAAEVSARLDSGEAGSLAEIARDRGIQDVQSVLEATDSQYGRRVQGLTEGRDQQILDEVSAEFEEFTPSTEPILKEKANSSLNQAVEAVEQRSRQAAVEVGVPERASGEVDAAFDAARGEEGLRQATAEAERIASGIVPLRASNAENTIPPGKRDTVFEGVDRASPEAMYGREKEFWADEAFNEVRNHQPGFSLDADFIEDMGGRLDSPEVRTTLTDFMDDALKRIAANKGIDIPDMRAADFNYDTFIADLTSGKLSGDEMISLRNYFATQANKNTNNVASNTNRNIASALDKRIIDELPDELSTQFIETKEAYPSHLANRDLMENPTTVLDYGEYSPSAQVRAQSKYGYPNDLEANRAANRAQTESKVRLEAAQKEAAATNKVFEDAQKAASRAVDAETKILTDSGKKVEGLRQTRLKNFADNPIQEIQKLLSSTTAKSTDELSEIKRIMEADGAGTQFDSILGESLVRMINDSKSGKGARVMPKAVKDMERYVNRLIESGIVSDPKRAANLADSIEKAAVKEYLEGGSKAGLGEVDKAANNDLASSMAAAAALRTLAPGSSSLILANAFKRTFARIMTGTSQRKSIETLKELTANPQRFIDIMKVAKSDDEAMRLLITEMVGVGQANEILGEE